MKITHFGHACVLLEFPSDEGETRVLIDPGTYATGFEHLSDLHAILVTHEHPDHLDLDRLPSLVKANPEAQLIVDPGGARRLADTGLDHRSVSTGGVEDVGGTTVEAIGGHHAEIYRQLPPVSNNGYLFDDLVLHPGDAFDLPQRPVKVLLLPTGGPWMKVGESIDYLRAVDPELVIPIHQAGLATVHRQLHYQLFSTFAPQRTQVEVLQEGIAFSC